MANNLKMKFEPTRNNSVFLLKFLTSVDKYVSQNLRKCGIETRPVDTNGLWCCCLVPAVLVSYTWLNTVSPLYCLLAYISVGLLLNSLMFILFISVSCLVLKEKTYGDIAASGLSSALLVYIFLNHGAMFSLIFSLIPVYFYNILLKETMMKLSKTFTLGEAMIVIQTIVLTMVVFLANICGVKGDIGDDKGLVNVIIFTGFSSLGLIVAALYFMKVEDRTMTNLSAIVAGAVIFMFLMLHLVWGPNVIVDIVNFTFGGETKIQLFLFWLFLSLVAVAITQIRTKLAVKASTVMRKSFHLLASLVFLSGILYDPDLMRLAAGFGFAVIVLLEALRKSGIEPLSTVLQAAFEVYSDEKDCGFFAVTPLYLFAGLACPLVLVPATGSRLELLSGVLATGVGDSAASWFGSRWGKNKWPGGNRTLEGTAFNVLSQILVVYALELFGLLDSRWCLTRTCGAATITAIVEARTDQVDNLVLPLVTLLTFQATWFLR